MYYKEHIQKLQVLLKYTPLLKGEAEALSVAVSLMQETWDNPYARIFFLVGKFHTNPQDVMEWLNTPHAELSNHRPLELIITGQARVVCDMLESAYAGVPT